MFVGIVVCVCDRVVVSGQVVDKRSDQEEACDVDGRSGRREDRQMLGVKWEDGVGVLNGVVEVKTVRFVEVSREWRNRWSGVW